MTIQVLYTCPDCGLHRVSCQVQARGEEDVVVWMNATMAMLGEDHRRRSPDCHPQELHDVMIPMTGADKIGGPQVQ